MESTAERVGAWGAVAFGCLLALLGGVALVGRAADSSLVPGVRALVVVAGISVAVGGGLVATDRLPPKPVLQLAGAPLAIAGSAVAVTTGDPPWWLAASAGAGLACALLGFGVVAWAAGDRA
jgi:hypothetical protein